MNNKNNIKFNDFLYTDIYLISIVNPSNATVISCRQADNFLNIGDNVFANTLMSIEERQVLHRKMFVSENNIVATSIDNRLAFIIPDMSSSLNCFVAIFPRLPYKDVLSLIKTNRLGEFDIFKSTENELYEYLLPCDYKIEETYQLLNKLISQINIYRHSSETVSRSKRNLFLSSERILQKIIGAADFIGCKLYVKEANFKPYNMINLNLCSLCDYTLCVLLLARRLSVTHSATLTFVEQSNMLSFVYTIDCYIPSKLDSSTRAKFFKDNYPELSHCEKSSNFNNCIFNYKIEHKNNKVELIISISTYANDNSAFGLKAPF